MFRPRLDLDHRRLALHDRREFLGAAPSPSPLAQFAHSESSPAHWPPLPNGTIVRCAGAPRALAKPDHSRPERQPLGLELDPPRTSTRSLRGGGRRPRLGPHRLHTTADPGADRRSGRGPPRSMSPALAYPTRRAAGSYWTAAFTAPRLNTNAPTLARITLAKAGSVPSTIHSCRCFAVCKAATAAPS